jgi:hypothetical protein
MSDVYLYYGMAMFRGEPMLKNSFQFGLMVINFDTRPVF